MPMRRASGEYRTQCGFSVIEQAMVAFIVAILVSIAVPALQPLLLRHRLQAAQMDFISALQHARETALTSRRQILFCPSQDNNLCTNSSRWDTGWLSGQDDDTDSQPDHGPIYRGNGYANKLVILSSEGRHAVHFHPDGSATGSNITLLFCAPGKTTGALSVVVSNAGRIRGAIASATQAASCIEST